MLQYLDCACTSTIVDLEDERCVKQDQDDVTHTTTSSVKLEIFFSLQTVSYSEQTE